LIPKELPTPKNSKVSTKNAIIETISEKFPLSAKEIYFSIKKKYGLSVTYQAIHKTIKELVENLILIKEDNKYKISQEWIKEIKQFSTNLEKAYLTEDLSQQKYPTKLVFDTYYKMYSFVNDWLYEGKFDTKGKPICFVDKHWWNTIIMTEEQAEKLRAFCKRYTFYCTATCDGPLDLSFMNFFKEQGMNCINNPNVKDDIGMVVIGDLLVQIFYSEQLRKTMDELADSFDKDKSIDFTKMTQELVHKKNEIIMLINKDEMLAERIRKETLSYFK
jgi:hypothetical protein